MDYGLNKERNKHKYSTYLVLLVFFLALLVNVYSVEVGQESVCVDGEFLVSDNGSWSCESFSYVEGYFYNETSPETIVIEDSGVFVDITGFNEGTTRGFHWGDDSVVVCDEPGVYLFSGSLSFIGGEGGEYEFFMEKNGVIQYDCSMLKTSASSDIENVGFTCLVPLSLNDSLNMVVEDVGVPAKNINIYGMNLNIVEVSK